MTRTFILYGCAPCHARWWHIDREPNPGHECPKGYPASGMLVARLEEPEPLKPIRSLRPAA